MEEPEEFYKDLCSTETLRSGKKGFFHDFSEHLVDVAGELWISKIFGRVADDYQRVRTIFEDEKIRETVAQVLSRVQPLFRDKDADISRRRRLEGFECAAAGEYEKALLLLSQAVLRAPSSGKCKTVDQGCSLSLALLGRAEVFMSLKEYHHALVDLKLAAENNPPDKSRAELQRRKEECERFLRENESSVVAIDPRRKRVPELSGGHNRTLPAASSSLEIRETPTAGKHAVATAEIHPGDCLVTEAPLAGCLLPEFYGTHCQHCYSRLRAPVGCPNCSSVAFCGTECRDAAMSSYHKYECKILALLIGSGMSVLSTLAFRMVTQEGLKRCLKIYDKLSGKATHEDENTKSTVITTAETKLSKSARRRLRKKKLKEFKNTEESESNVIDDSRELHNEDHSNDDNDEAIDLRAYELVMHETKRSAKDFFERTLMAAFLLKCLQRVDFFENPSQDNEAPNAVETAVGALVLKNLQLLQFNAHEFFETRHGARHRFRGSRPAYLGVAIYPTVARFNHDCYPAVTRYFVGKNIVIRATRTLKPGDVVAENYGPIFTKRSLDERQRSLSGRYWFRCACKACREDWPSFERLTNESARLRCPTQGCNRLHPRALGSAKSAKCPGCRKKISLETQLTCLTECEASYARGLAAMEAERPEEALRILTEAAKKFHEVAAPPHKDTHLAEIALAACMADSGNTWSPVS